MSVNARAELVSRVETGRLQGCEVSRLPEASSPSSVVPGGGGGQAGILLCQPSPQPSSAVPALGEEAHGASSPTLTLSVVCLHRRSLSVL